MMAAEYTSNARESGLPIALKRSPIKVWNALASYMHVNKRTHTNYTTSSYATTGVEITPTLLIFLLVRDYETNMRKFTSYSSLVSARRPNGRDQAK